MDAFGAASAVAYYPAMHLGLGSVMSATAMNVVMLVSFGLFSWLSWLDLSQDGDDCEPEYPYPPPAFVDSVDWGRTVNFAVVGPAGSGKSSLVNILRGLHPSDADAAPVGLDAAAAEPRFYHLMAGAEAADAGCKPQAGECKCSSCKCSPMTSDGSTCPTEADKEPRAASGSPRAAASWEDRAVVRVWDMPGWDAGVNAPEGCCSELGLAYFDAVMIVYSERITSFELGLLKKLDETLRVPTFLVRSQVDVDVENEVVDHGRSEEDTLHKLRSEAIIEGGCSKNTMFLVDSTQPQKHDLPDLFGMIAKIAKARERALSETECPICFEDFGRNGKECRICHWCGNVVCGRCARKLRSPQGPATCPFCRRSSYLFKAPSGSEAQDMATSFF